ncbi:MAG: TonB-dependent receptor [Tannerella sp.]|jgi:outer membrane cobalamin receptor|nr:TonB-dependent receptor [Tannerella sp.]
MHRNSQYKILKICLVFALLLAGASAGAQTLRGHVYALENGTKSPLVGAHVYFPNFGNGVTTDEKGAFAIERKDASVVTLIAGFVGFTSDTIRIAENKGDLEFILRENAVLDEVVVSVNRQGTVLSRLTAGKTELITTTGLAKMACCNLSESFENSATVTVGFTDAISGARQVQLLGLSGIYSQLLTENVPTHRGLLSPFGWSYIPGPWLESIQISKGASSVVNGYESIAGQINLEMKKPDYTDPLFVNAYGDLLGRYELNITSAAQVNRRLWTGLLLHGSTDTGAHDYNGDTFLDMPKSKFVNLANRWFYLNESGIQSRTTLRFLYDSRDGGQDEAHHGADNNFGHDELYKTKIRNRNIGIDNKTGFAVGDRESQSIGIISSFNLYDENLDYGSPVYGNKLYEGRQSSFYSNILFTSGFGEQHRYTVGASFAWDNYVTRFEDRLPLNATPSTALDRYETVPGFFGEYTATRNEKFTFVLGVREDWNSRYGWLFTPRANVRYNPLEALALRASAGRGYHSANVVAENIGLLASSRRFDLDQVNSLDIERAWNYGGNISAYIPIGAGRTLTVSLDYFHTQFQNQAVVDVERDRNSVFFYNQHGISRSDVWQADISANPFTGFEVFAAFRYNNTRITYTDPEGVDYEREKPLTSRYRGLLNLTYATRLRKWVFDFTAQVNGPSRIPGLNGYGSALKMSTSYPVYFAQITKNTKRFDIYAGAENILDFKQKNPILNPDQSFGRDFDSSLVWGPVTGRKLYAGIRLRMGKLH